MGHPAAIFLAPPDANLRCAICLDVFSDPVSLGKCGHTFCRGCLDECLFSVGPTCPECRAGIDFEDDEDEGLGGGGGGNVIHSARVIKSVVEAATVRCGNCLDENGEVSNGNGPSCTWTGPLSHWPLHSSRHCAVTRITCPVKGCGHACPRSKMKAHVGSPACVKAAVVSQVETQMNRVLGSLRKQMKEEMDRRLKKERSAVAKEKKFMAAERRRYESAKLELTEVNYLLRRENKKLRKRIEEKDHLLMENRAVHAAMELSLETAAKAQGRSKRAKKRRSNSTASTSSMSYAADDEGNALMENGSRRRKKNKKRKRSRQQEGGQRAVEESRTRSVSAASEADVGAIVNASDADVGAIINAVTSG